KKGDRVFIFMPRSPELYFVFIGAIKIGAIVGPLFEACMEKAVVDRLEDSEANILITTSDLLERGPDNDIDTLEHVFVVGDDVKEDEKVIDFKTLFDEASNEFDIEWVDLEDGLILHYTSGSTGSPKGVYHVHNVMIQQYISGKYVTDIKEDEVYWCTADPGWGTGTRHGICAAWVSLALNVRLGGGCTPEGWYLALEVLKVTIWYSARTAFRMLMGAGEEVIKPYDLSNLRHLLSLVEPLNPEVIKWG